MKKPKYYFMVFGNPRPPGKDRIESGIYHPDVKFAPFPTEPGDIVLLYCTTSYSGHEMRVPGIGIVVGTETSQINYRYLPLTETISKHELDLKLEPKDKRKLSNIRFSSHWLFQISKRTFLNVLGGRGILWP